MRAVPVIFIGTALAGCAVTPPARVAQQQPPAPRFHSTPAPVIPAAPPRIDAPMDFEIQTCWGTDNQCPNLIYAVGTITPGTAARFEAFAKRINAAIAAGVQYGPATWAVAFDSLGGDVAASLELGATIRRNGGDEAQRWAARPNNQGKCSEEESDRAGGPAGPHGCGGG
jgi:hypothetical protein